MQAFLPCDLDILDSKVNAPLEIQFKFKLKSRVTILIYNNIAFNHHLLIPLHRLKTRLSQ